MNTVAVRDAKQDSDVVDVVGLPDLSGLPFSGLPWMVPTADEGPAPIDIVEPKYHVL